MCYYLTPLACGPGRQWPGGSKWCELWTVVVSSLSLSTSTPWASRDSQRARCGLALLWPCQNKCANENTCTQLHTVKHTHIHREANINNDTDRKPTYTHVWVCLCLEPHTQLSMSKDSLPLPPFVSCSLYLSLSLVTPLSSPVAGVELLISTAMNTLPKDGEGRRESCVCV